MWKKSEKREQGFTFVEILTCLAIVALVVGPICFSFLSSLKTRVTAESITQATKNAERMLEDVKVQITDDIIRKQMVEGSRVSTSTYEADVNGISNYLVSSTSRGTTHLNNFLKGTSSADFASRYNTDQYDYEVALWRMDDLFPVVSTGNVLKMDASTLVKATKFYTDSSAGYGTFNYSGEMLPITFSATGEMLEVFQDASLMYVPNQSASDASYRIMDKNKLIMSADFVSASPSISFSVENWLQNTGATDEAIKISSIREIKEVNSTTSTVVGYAFDISNGGSATAFAGNSSYYRGIIELDTRSLLRMNSSGGASYSNQSMYDKFTFKFNNATPYDQLIYVRQNALTSAEASSIDEKFNIVAEDTGTGKSTIVRVDDIDTYENYIIAIIVREKSPVLGKSGKIVKKMIDIFSYDLTMNQRR